jgi:uncharacterized repeat protein (TIGR01451 family)
VISNQGYVEFTNASNLAQTFTSNTIDVVTLAAPSASSIEFTRVTGGGGDYQEMVGPSACVQGASVTPYGNPTLSGGNAIDPTLLHNVSVSGSYNLGEPAFIRLTDTDQNNDYLQVEYAMVSVSHPASGDTETVQLTETGPNTGIFAGFVPTANAAAAVNDCVLQGGMNSSINVSYTDPGNAGDVAGASARLDPVNLVFESRTGNVVDGAIIEIVDATTGMPATVYGNDGVSTFPSAITSGGTETDSAGQTYAFGPGEFRFPVVPDGDYRLLVTPSSDHAAPSGASIGDLQTLPGAPYDLGPGSFGDPFSHSGTVSFEVDIPVDPQSTALYLQKTTLTTIAAPGDFVRYELTIENAASSGIATGVSIVDQLPSGV